MRNAASVPVSPATAAVREAFTPDEPIPPVAGGEGSGQIAGDETGGQPRKQRVALVAACVLAFAVGFAGMTALTGGSDTASSPSPSPKPTQPAPSAGLPAAPAPSVAKAPTSVPAPASSALVSDVGNDQTPAPQSSPPSMPQTETADSPTSSTTTSEPSTSAPTTTHTTPSTTTP